jgi:GH24 family phage-related lysozyme (muramidase)
MVERQKVIDLLTRHEGLRAYTYRDTKGKLTIGYGFNLDAPGAAERCAAAGVDYNAVCFGGHGITQAQAQALLDEGITVATDAALCTVVGFLDMPEVVQLVVIDMLFNMGRNKFQTFHRMILALEARDWRQMVEEMRDSDWCKEVNTRANEDIALVLSAL